MGLKQVTLLILCIGIVMICVIGYFLYFLYSTHKNNKVLKEDLHTLNERIIANNFTLKIDVKSKVYTLYSRKFGAPSISYSQKKFESLITDDKSKKEFKKWFTQLCENSVDIPDLLITMHPFELAKDALFRFSIVNRDDKNKIYFLSGNLVPKARASKINETTNINAFAFRQRLKNVFDEKKNKTGTFMILNFNLYDYVLKKYGEEGLQKYLSSIWSVLSTFDNGVDIIAGIYRFDNFIMYFKGTRGKLEISRLVKDMVDEIGDYVGLNDLEIPVNIHVGYAYFGEFTDNLESAMRQAYNASLWGIANDALLVRYDYSIDQIYQAESILVYKLQRDILDHKFHAEYQHIFDLARGRIIGSFAMINLHQTEYKSMSKTTLLAYENDILDQFIGEVSDVIVKEYQPYSSFSGKTIFMLIDSIMLEIVYDVFKNNQQFREARPVIVVKDYDNLIASKKYIDVVNAFVKMNIRMGVVAHEKMETTINPILKKFRYVIWTKSFLSDVLQDTKAAIRFDTVLDIVNQYNKLSIAYHIDSYDMAEFLRDKGILMMTGPIFGLEDSNVRSNKVYSVRRLNKLLNKDYGE